MENNFNKGSEWRKWDLHFHTPSSYDYLDKSVTNEDIINVLFENRISVVAITDHHIIDIKRINELKKIGSEKGITILPGIEFRSELGGSEIIHFIGVFSEKCDLSEIWTDIQSQCDLKPSRIEELGNDGVYVDLKETTELIHKLGGVTTVHAGRKTNTIENIKNNNDYKIQIKKDLLKQNIDILEIGKPKIDEKGYKEIVFPSINMKLPLIICSDNHNIKEYKIKENCWIKANPTFEGLKQILIEPEERVFIGEEPEIIKRVENNKTKYIKSIAVNQTEGYSGYKGEWFNNVDIELNNELVAIIGNKGSGKSAIADIIALCGNFKKHDSFSFLHNKKFRKRQLAKHFEGILTWESSNEVKRNLLELPKDDQIIDVKYLPQGDFENLTNEIDKADEFQKEIESVVYSHIDKFEKGSFSNFTEMIDNSKSGVDNEIRTYKNKIEIINNEIIKLEAKLTPRYKSEIEGKIKQKEDELSALVVPEEVKNPNTDEGFAKNNKEVIVKIDNLTKELNSLKKEYEESKIKIHDLHMQRKTLITVENGIKQIIKTAKDEINDLKKYLIKYNLDINDIVKIETDYTVTEKSIAESNKAINLLNEKNGLSDDDESGIRYKIIKIQEQLEIEKQKLDGPQKKYQEYLKQIEEYKNKRKSIEGDKETSGTLAFYKNEIKYISEELLFDIEKKSNDRIEIVKDIFNSKLKIIEIYKEFKNKIDEKIEENKSLLEDYKINIDASFILKNDFSKKFLSFIQLRKSGSFHQNENAEIQLSKIIDNKDINTVDGVVELLNTIIEYLKIDQRPDQKELNRFIEEQVNDIGEFYNYLFSIDYIDYNYKLKLGDKDIEQLSPGERGALLLVFYLLLDQNDIPLILDQPEDNLDNHSVANVLVPFIRKAKQKRQIILVTHNPNLAVVADAEQIIWVDINKNNKNKFEYISGSIEDREINKCIVNVLEGAMPAFNKRKQKYYEN